ncbi:hypothetical protein MMC21_000106 [Puttea exsequens]|nr:hypothetical protein [Puttea exsequens]
MASTSYEKSLKGYIDAFIRFLDNYEQDHYANAPIFQHLKSTLESLNIEKTDKVWNAIKHELRDIGLEKGLDGSFLETDEDLFMGIAQRIYDERSHANRERASTAHENLSQEVVLGDPSMSTSFSEKPDDSATTQALDSKETAVRSIESNGDLRGFEYVGGTSNPSTIQAASSNKYGKRKAIVTLNINKSILKSAQSSISPAFSQIRHYEHMAAPSTVATPSESAFSRRSDSQDNIKGKGMWKNYSYLDKAVNEESNHCPWCNALRNSDYAEIKKLFDADQPLVCEHGEPLASELVRLREPSLSKGDKARLRNIKDFQLRGKPV